MTSKLEYDNVITVGFINETEPSEDMKASYIKAFDIVIIGDANFTALSQILAYVTKSDAGWIESEDSVTKLIQSID